MFIIKKHLNWNIFCFEFFYFLLVENVTKNVLDQPAHPFLISRKQKKKQQINTMFCLKYTHTVHKTMPHVQNEAITLLILKTDFAVLQNLVFGFSQFPGMTPNLFLHGVKTRQNGTHKCAIGLQQSQGSAALPFLLQAPCVHDQSVFPFSGLTETANPAGSMLVLGGIVRHQEVCMPAPACLFPSVLC